jgi:hypothetical protein
VFHEDGPDDKASIADKEIKRENGTFLKPQADSSGKSRKSLEIIIKAGTDILNDIFLSFLCFLG